MGKNKMRLGIGAGCLAAFLLWTLMIRVVDVQAIGPLGTTVGLAGINQSVHKMTGVHPALYTVTDSLSLVPIGICMWFGLLGLTQWLRRKSLRSVDRSLLALGGLYVVVIAAYLFFEHFAVNYRPVLIDGFLEPSYPSSTTLLVLCVMPTCMMQLEARSKRIFLKRCIALSIIAFTLFMVAGRLVSGVHWFSDIIGSVLLSAGLTALYSAVVHITE